MDQTKVVYLLHKAELALTEERLSLSDDVKKQLRHKVADEIRSFLKETLLDPILGSSLIKEGDKR